MRIRELLSNIFRDARIVDVDLSEWDQCVRLAVVAMEATVFPSKRFPVYVVELRGVTECVLKFAHYERAPDFGHYQWNVDEIRFEESDSGTQMHLSGSRLMPTAMIKFTEVDIRQLDNGKLDQRFPGWNQAGAALVRPGIERELDEK
jgi:hypothetical protein